MFLAFSSAVGLATLRLEYITNLKELSSYSQKVIEKNPIAYWRLGETHGPTAFDNTPNTLNGIFYGAPIYSQKGAILSELDTAISLDGYNSYVEVPNSQLFSQPTSGQGLTVEAWIKPENLIFPGEAAGYVHWLGKGERGQHEWAFRFYSKDSSRPNRISAYIWNPEGGLGAGAFFQDILTPNDWIHVVACYDPGDQTNTQAGVSIYKNGEFRGGPATSSASLYKTYNIEPTHGSAPLRLGTRDRGSFLVGGLDEVAIYPRVLTAAEIMDNYQTAIESCAVLSPQPTLTHLPTAMETISSIPTTTATQTVSSTSIATPETVPQYAHSLYLPLIQR